VLQAHAEARAAMEAAAEQRLAAALARERAQADKQARSLLCTHGPWLHRPSLVLQRVYAADREHDMLCTCMHVVAELSYNLQACRTHEGGPCLHDQDAVAQVREARAEAEAAAEQRLAALDQACREEREAAVREALALGARRVRTCPLASPPLHAFSCTPSRHAVRQTLHQAATEHTRSGPGTGARAFAVAQQAAVPC